MAPLAKMRDNQIVVEAEKAKMSLPVEAKIKKFVKIRQLDLEYFAKFLLTVIILLKLASRALLAKMMIKLPGLKEAERATLVIILEVS